jgi:hypothetical protein
MMNDDRSASDLPSWMSLAEAFKHVVACKPNQRSAQILLRENIKNGHIGVRGRLYYKDRYIEDTEFNQNLFIGCTIHWNESRFSYDEKRQDDLLGRTFGGTVRRIREGEPSDFFEIEVLSADVFRIWPLAKINYIKSAIIPNISEHKHSGGRPRKWDREGALIEMARVAVFGESCEREDLMKAVQDWFMKETGSEPPDRSIREHVKRFHEALWPPKT